MIKKGYFLVKIYKTEQFKNDIIIMKANFLLGKESSFAFRLVKFYQILLAKREKEMKVKKFLSLTLLLVCMVCLGLSFGMKNEETAKRKTQ